MTDIGRYMINQPGPGAEVGFVEDPHIRLQGWGANLRTNTINAESDLLGLTRSLTKDFKNLNQYDKMSVDTREKKYATITPTTEESRAIMPPWQVIDTRIERWQYMHHDPLQLIQNAVPQYGGRSSRIDNKNDYSNHYSYLRN